MDNIEDLFKSSPATEDIEPSFNYQINTKDGLTTHQTGYIVANSLFLAICRGEGVIYWMTPFENVVNVVNNGPSGTTVN